MYERYVLLGLASARAPWFRAVAAWATAASLPADFVKCVSVEEVRARLSSGRPVSALLVDGRLPALDRDVVDLARAAGAAVLVVDDGRSGRDWAAVGVSRVLPDGFDRRALLDALSACAAVVPRAEVLPGDPGPVDNGAGVALGRLVAVCGAGGTGVSTVATALAQGVADSGDVVLADLALHAEQAVLHDARDVVPGVQELVEAFRSGRPSADEVRSFAFHVEERGYDLVLGLRRARAWSTLRPRAFEAAVDGLRAAYSTVVCDTDADIEGEDAGGSADVEDRHVMARTALRVADVVLVVASPGTKGLHSMVRVMGDLREFGVPADRLVPVVNRAPRSRRARAEVASAFASLVRGAAVATPLFLPERDIDNVLRDGVRLPAAVVAPLVGAVEAVAQRRSAALAEPVPLRPGTVTSWSFDAEEAG
jgi:CO dehydrogenase nickel-insertion accessory protein CooC1